jgi:hypothetical protein
MLPDEALIEFFDKLYKAYILDCLKGVDLKWKILIKNYKLLNLT